MFDVHCPHHQSRVLLSARAITATVTTAAGVEVHWTCYCGTTGVLLTGRPAGTTIEPAPELLTTSIATEPVTAAA